MTDNRETRTYGAPMPLHSQRATYDGYRSVRLLHDDVGLATTTYSYKLSYDEVQEAAERIALMWNLHLGESVEELRLRYLEIPSPQPNVEGDEAHPYRIDPSLPAWDVVPNAERIIAALPDGQREIIAKRLMPNRSSEAEGPAA